MRKLLSCLGVLFLILSGAKMYAQTALPYSINLGESQEGWSAIDNSEKPGFTWTYKEKGAYSQGKYYPCVVLDMDYSSTSNDYYISPAFQLEPDVEYTINTILCTTSPANGIDIALEIGTSATDMSTFTKISDCPVPDSFTNTDIQTFTFTVESAGIYHFAFHATAPKYNSNACLFQFELTDNNGGTEPEDPVGNIPYDINMMESMANRGWHAYDNNQDGTTWVETIGFGVSMQMALGTTHEDDYVSPKFPLVGGKTYKISTNVIVSGINNPADVISLVMGDSPENMASVQQLTLNQSGENTEEIYVKAENDGFYYFGFRNQSYTGGNTLILYRFALEEADDTPTTGDVVFTSDFDAANPLEGWEVIDANQDRVTWEKTDGIEGITYHGSLAVGAADDWLITPAFTVQSGTDYLIRYTLTQSGAFDADLVEIRWGENPTTEAMSNLVTTETVDLGNGEHAKVCRLNAQSNKDIHLAFRIVTPDMNGSLSLKQVEVVSSEKAVPNPVENLKASSDYQAKTVTLTWKNPAFDTEQAPIQNGLEANIYENNNLIKTLTELTPGMDGIYTYTPSIAFTGDVTYKVTASLQGRESTAAEATLCLDDQQGDSLLAYDLSMKEQEAFEQWLIEDKNGGETWTYEVWNQQVVIPFMSPDNDDWIFSPEMELTTEKRYILKYEFKSSSFGSDLDVTIGQERTSSAHTRILVSHENAQHNGYQTFATEQFSVAENGIYSIGFHAGKVENSMAIRNVTLYYIGEKEEIPVMQLPYFQNFGEETVGEDWMPEGWKAEGNSGLYGFQVLNTLEWFGIEAYSAPNALAASGGVPSAREEWIYTPKFTFEQGVAYQVEFQLLMPVQNHRYNTLCVYQTSEHAPVSQSDNALFRLENTDIAEWTGQSFEFIATESGDFCLAIQVASNLSATSNILLDDFSIRKVEKEAIAPAAPTNVRGNATQMNGVKLQWNNPILDCEGGELLAGTQITSRIYDGENLLGETTGLPGETQSLEYTYKDPADYNGQRIYKVVACIDDLQGGSSTCVVTLNDFTNGYLKEHTFIADFGNPTDWVIEDADQDGLQWILEAESAHTDGNDEWLITPAMNLTPGKSYYVICEIQTNGEEGANLTFAYGNKQHVEGMTENVHVYENLALSDYAELYVGGVFIPEEAENYLGIHVTENTSGVHIRNLKVMRLFSRNEPEEIPYTEDFEDQLNLDESTMFTNKWGRRTGSAELFRIAEMPEGSPEAPSGRYAAIANESEYGNRTETLYTPYFTLEQNKTYEVSYYLYMPGNEGRNTYGAVLLALTQENMGIELPVMQEITEPVKDWQKFSFRFTNTDETFDYCFYFYFEAAEGKSGIIAIDDFAIKAVEVGLEETRSEELYYDCTCDVLHLPENMERVDVFTLQGTVAGQYAVTSSELSLNLQKGIYIVRAYRKDGYTTTLKIIK